MNGSSAPIPPGGGGPTPGTIRITFKEGTRVIPTRYSIVGANNKASRAAWVDPLAEIPKAQGSYWIFFLPRGRHRRPKEVLVTVLDGCESGAMIWYT